MTVQKSMKVNRNFFLLNIVWVVAILSMTRTSQAQWVKTNGPHNEILTYGGYVYSLGSIGNDLFAGTPSAGVILSTDNGSTWRAVNNGLTDLTVYALLVSGGNLFTGTDSGLFLSTDSGTNWNQLPFDSSNSYSIGAIAVSGDNIIVGGIN
jgi:photosystem II stability/assembly factor-like uncharacterized protein